MFIWGRNNNHLFRQNHKKTYSLPQKIPLHCSIAKCAPGYDYVLILTGPLGSLTCFHQSAFYKVTNFSNIVDVATTDNMIVIVDSCGTAWIMEFNPQKIVSGEINPSKINLQEQVTRVYMNYSDIFLTTSQQSVYHLKRNQWYQTKTYSDPQKVQGLIKKNIRTIAPGGNYNYFLFEDGQLFRSEKTHPTQAAFLPSKPKFKAIAAADYFVGIGENGRLYIWGEYNGQNYTQPTEFGKLAQEFRSVQLSGENGFAITITGQGWIWGKNASGQLGISDYEPRVNPFPLITMEQETIKDIYIGQGYTVCTVANSQSKNNQINFKKHSFNITIEPGRVDQASKKKGTKPQQKSREKLSYFDQKHPKKKEQDVFIGDFSSLKLRKPQKHTHTREQQNRSMQTEVMRLKKNKLYEKTPRKSNEKVSHRSLSPLSQKSRSNSKSPVGKSTKSPYLDHQRHQSYLNVPKRKEFTFSSNRNAHGRTNTVIDLKSLHGERVEREERETKKSNASGNKSLLAKIKELQDQNSKLNQILAIKDNIIQDITHKIGLLQEAIEEHQKSLTARDNQMEEYQRREKQYQIHIDQLQKHIDNLIKGKNQQLDYTKEKDQFLAKMAEYQEILKNQRTHYRQKIKNLEEEINTFRSMDKENCLSSSRIQYNRTSSVKNQDRPPQSKPLEQKDLKMNFIISRIEESKVRIAKSATKLYEMMEDN